MGTLTIKDIAKMCNVGIGTVSRAINDEPGISAKTKEKILKVIAENNYVPNNSARNLKMTESNTIALLIRGIDNQFFQDMLKIFEEELKKIKYSFIIHAVGEDQDQAAVAIELAKEKRLKGIIFLGGLIDHADEKLKNLGIPYVMCSVALNVDTPQRNSTSIAVNDEIESYRAVDYLIKKGHKKIAVLSGRNSDYSVGHERLEGYKRALEENGVPFDQNLVIYMKDDIPEYTMANGYAMAKDLIESKKEFTAIFAISDIIAFGAYKAISEAGKKIPEDYSVVGFDGLEMSDYFVPSLTTIEQPCGEMVKKSIEVLMENIDGNKVENQIVFEGLLKERDSVLDLKN